MRRSWIVACLALLVMTGACGGGLSMADYVEQLNAVMEQANREYQVLVTNPQYEVLVAEGSELERFAPQDLRVGLDKIGEIELNVLEQTAKIEPPAALGDLHELMFDDRFTTAREALAARAAAAESWDELSATPEMAAYRAAVARDKEVCGEIQAELDATAARGVFADTPWIPGELKEVVDAVVGCASFPEDPQDLYRPG